MLLGWKLPIVWFYKLQDRPDWQKRRPASCYHRVWEPQCNVSTNWTIFFILLWGIRKWLLVGVQETLVPSYGASTITYCCIGLLSANNMDTVNHRVHLYALGTWVTDMRNRFKYLDILIHFLLELLEIFEFFKSTVLSITTRISGPLNLFVISFSEGQEDQSELQTFSLTEWNINSSSLYGFATWKLCQIAIESCNM